MSPYELLDLVLSLSDRLDTHWTLFISVHMAIIGGIIYVDRPLSRKEKVGGSLVYTGYLAINYLVMEKQLGFLSSIYERLRAMKDDACCIDNPIIEYVLITSDGKFSISNIYMVSIVHVLMFIIIILLIFYDEASQKNEKSEN